MSFLNLNDCKLEDELKGHKEKLKVFISSSMNDEDGHDWATFRSELACQIACSSVLTPFAIENYGSPISSEQYYLTNIEQADIVVAVIYGELRAGTENEIRYAVDLKKPLLFTKVGDKEDRQTSDLIKYLHGIDFCTTARRDSFNELPSLIVRDIENTVTLLFRGRMFEIMQGRASGIGMDNQGDAAVSVDVIESFGSSLTKLLRRYDCFLDWLEPKSDSLQLESLGNAIIDWAVDGKDLDILLFKDSMLAAMKDSGCDERTLGYRYDAMSMYFKGDYKGAFSKIEQARVSVANKDAWLYGNILIDKRNISSVALNDGSPEYLATQEEISASKRAIVFPLASKYKCSALEELEASQRNKRTRKPGSITVDNRAACALRDIASYMFVSALFGSIASLVHSRSLLARVLFGYSDVYDSPQYAYEGIRIILLSGEYSVFEKEFDSRFCDISIHISSEADELWELSKMISSERRPAACCALIKRCGSYFSDRVFESVVQYLTEDKSTFSRCWDRRAKAIDSIKLRMRPDKFVQLVTEIIVERQYIIADSVGSIIRGYPLSDIEEDNLKLAAVLRDNKAGLIEDGMALSTFAFVERVSGEKILDFEMESCASIEAAAYKVNLQSGDKKSFLKECLQELAHQVNTNNFSGAFIHFGHDVVTPICNLIQEKGADVFDAEDIGVLEETVRIIANYRGALSVVDGVLRICFELKCASKSRDLGSLEHGLHSISLDNYRENAVPFDEIGFAELGCRLLALWIVMGIEDATRYLSKGVNFSFLSYEAKKIYASTFAQIVKVGYVPDSQKEFASAVALSMCGAEEEEVRKSSIKCIAACSGQWGSAYFRNAYFKFARDPSDSVRYALLSACMNNELGDEVLSNELYGLLRNDANWFISWHADHDENRLDDVSIR